MCLGEPYMHATSCLLVLAFPSKDVGCLTEFWGIGKLGYLLLIRKRTNAWPRVLQSALSGLYEAEPFEIYRQRSWEDHVGFVIERAISFIAAS